MKTLITASLLALGLGLAPAQAKDVWTTLNESAPRSILDQIRDSAPRAAAGSEERIVGELHPVFEQLNASAP